MKKSIIVIFLIICNYSFAQNGKIYPKNAEIKAGELNTYLYEPPVGLVVPENASAHVFYEPSFTKTIPLVKKDNLYEFSIKVPDSIQVLIMTIVDKKKVAIDHNFGNGYTVYLNKKTPNELAKSKLSRIKFSYPAAYYLKLNNNPDEIISQFDALYAQNPELKKDDSYGMYLSLHYQKDREKYKPELINYIESTTKKENENSLLYAFSSYDYLDMPEKRDEIKKISLELFPTGKLARSQFYYDSFNSNEKTEQYFLSKLKAYIAQFNDSSENSLQPLHQKLLAIYLENKDTLNMKRYEGLFTDKLTVANMYNEQAWQLSGQDLVTPGTDLDFAERISRKSIDITKDLMSHPDEKTDLSLLQTLYIRFADTYALIMYKLQKYDEAFRYQNGILDLDENAMDTGGQERYAGYAEKAKGLEFTKAYIEKRLNSGVDSRIMMNQLEGIYRKLSLPMSDFEKMKENSFRLMVQTSKEAVIKEYGTQKSFDFNLVNLNGKEVKLSDYKGKVVILDFWATWCGPCRASFPAMQELVTNYKNKNVEFFFINVWEKNKPDVTKVNVSKLIKDKNYSFNVLYDFNNEVANKYKVQAIPKKILINKHGEIVSAESSIDNLKLLIDENIK
jgi:Thiol-disulfide isomerase and thioredoxins